MPIFFYRVTETPSLIVVVADTAKEATLSVWDAGLTAMDCVEPTPRDTLIDLPRAVRREDARRKRRAKAVSRPAPVASVQEPIPIKEPTPYLEPKRRERVDEFGPVVWRPVEPIQDYSEPDRLPAPVVEMPRSQGVSHLFRNDVDRIGTGMLRRYSVYSKPKSRRYEGWVN